MNKLSLLELLDFIEESIDIIKKRFNKIEKIDDFLLDDEGFKTLDSIILRIQTIGEALKNIEKHEKSFLDNVATKEYWSQIIRFRDLISHHYVDINAEIIYEICNDKLDELHSNIKRLQKILTK